MININHGKSLLQDVVANAEQVGANDAEKCFITSAHFAALNLTHDWLIEKVMVSGEPLVIGGPKKSLKTSIVVDLAISLAAGFNTQFLKKFDVPKPRKVGLISGESGKTTLRKKARTICNEKSLNLENLSLHWRFQMPKFGNKLEIEELSELIKTHRFEVVIFDPMYLGLLAENPNANAGNVLHMGPLLQSVVNTCLPYGCTPILVHHTRKLGQRDGNRPLDLDDLSQSGFAEFARQWVLLSRRSDFLDGSGKHELWMRCGGSAGHSSLWGVDVDEGHVQDGISAGTWNVQVKSSKSIRDEKEVETNEKAKNKLKKLENEILVYLEQHPEGDTKTGIREALGVSSTVISQGIAAALDRELIKNTMVMKNNKSHAGYVLRGGVAGHPDNPDGHVCSAGS